MHQRVAGAVRGKAGALEPLAAKRTLRYFSILRTGERRAPFFHFMDSARCIRTEDFRCILIGEVIAPKYGIVKMILPVVLRMDGGVDAPLGLGGMGKVGIGLAQDGHIAFTLQFQGRPHAGESTAYNEHIVFFGHHTTLSPLN